MDSAEANVSARKAVIAQNQAPRDDEPEQDPDVAAVERADRRPVLAHPAEVEQGTCADRDRTDQGDAKLGDRLLQEGNRHVMWYRHVMLR